MRRALLPLLLACAGPDTAVDPAVELPGPSFAREGPIPALIELRATAQVDDDPAWTSAIARAADQAIACLGLPESRVLHRYVRVPVVFARLSADELQRAATCASVVRAEPDAEDRAQVDVVLDLIDAPATWEALGADGTGVGIGVVDSGIWEDQPDLTGRVAYAWDHAERDGDATDCSGHGSNVAGIAAAVAPGAHLLVHKVMSAARSNCNSALRSDTNRALDDLLGQRRATGLAVVNLSLGGGDRYAAACDDAIVGYTAAVRALTEAGVIVVAAAGNSSDPEGVTYPGCLSTTVAVANSVRAPRDGLATDDLWRSSNGGPLIDVAAPGTSVTAGGRTLTGTSMSSPAVAGAVAVLASVDGALSLPVVRERLSDSPVEVVDARGSETRRYPRLHLPSALRAARELAVPQIVDDGRFGSAGDGDGVAEDGETVAIGLRFAAPVPMVSARATLRCDDDGLRVLRSPIRLGDLDGDVDTLTSGATFLVEVPRGCDARTAPCDVALADADGRVRHLALPLPIACEDDRDGDGFTADIDCDDDDPHRYPGAPERCNGLDDNCDGVPDSGLIEPWARDGDGDGHGAPGVVLACLAPGPDYFPVAIRPDDDCDDTDGLVRPGIAERCNGIDDNCNGMIDEDAGPWWWPDLDGDGFGAGEPVQACEAPAGHADRGDDCDDTNPRVYPGGPDGDCVGRSRHGRRTCSGVGGAGAPGSAALLGIAVWLRSRRRRSGDPRARG